MLNSAKTTKIWYFNSFSLLSVLTEKEIDILDKNATMKRVAKGEVIYVAEDNTDAVFLLHFGKVKITRQGKNGHDLIMALLGPGQIFGELTTDDAETYDEKAVALEEAVVCSVKTSDFVSLMEMNNKFCIQVTKLLGLRLKRVQSRLESLISKSAEDRIRSVIKDLCRDHGTMKGLDNKKCEVQLRLTHDDIGNLSATSRQTVTSLLTELERKKLISYSRSTFTVNDLTQF